MKLIQCLLLIGLASGCDYYFDSEGEPADVEADVDSDKTESFPEGPLPSTDDDGASFECSVLAGDQLATVVGDQRSIAITDVQPRATPNLAVVGDAAVYCDRDDQLVVHERSSGRVVMPNVRCAGIASSSSGQILVLNERLDRGPAYSSFDSLEALVAGSPSKVFNSIPSTSGAISLSEKFIATSWHSTDRIELFDRETGAFVREVILEDFDGWVGGMAIRGSALYFLNRWHTERP